MSVLEVQTTWPAAAEKILDAADRLLGRHGYQKMTVESLAKEAGIGKGTVYLSFESKADVGLACIDRMAARVLSRIQAIGAGATPPEQRVREMLLERVLYRFDYARPHSSSIDDLLASLRPRLVEHRNEYFRAEAEALARVLEKGNADGTFEVADPRAAAAAMVTATNALLPYSLSVEELGRRDEISRRAHEIIHLLLRGIVAGRGSAKKVSSP